MNDLIVIGAAQLRRLVSMEDAVDAVAEAFISLSRGEAVQPPRLAMPDGRTLGMFVQVGDQLSVKVVTVRPENAAAGLPTLQSTVIWRDGAGRSALIEGAALTAMRTGAASGVATRLLAPEDASIMAMIGAGGQAADQIRAVAAVRRLREVRIAARRVGSAQTLADALGEELGEARLIPCETVADAVRDADIVTTATTAASPVLALEDLAETVHVNAIGAFRLDMCELPPELLAEAALIAIDEREAMEKEAGDVMAAVASGHIELGGPREIGELLQAPPQLPDRRRTVFKSVGVAVQDWALARLAVARAVEEGGAQVISLA
ncbi:MAG TPA: ornithine cyclodeaminase family protein [Candidatus Dormibacteraeota bacterium]|nr:ornithine cyclodeaminase family protein [Candidatus Dormibacteraeota bacterium]